MRTFIAAGAITALLFGAARPALAQPTVDWTKVMRALNNALNSWRLSPFPRRTPTPALTRTPIPGTATRTPSRTRPPSTSTRTATPTRTQTNTRPPTRTYTPRPTSTPVPTLANDGQIAFAVAEGMAPAQKLASAFIVFPYIDTEPPFDTRIELMNMSNQEVDLQCFYVREQGCLEIGFYVSLTANQPLSWSAFEGTNNTLTRTAVPPFDTFGGLGELKCAVASERAELSAHNVLQGRAIVVNTSNGETVGYGAVGFQKLSEGAYTGVIDLDGFTYEACPDRLHFQALTVPSGGPAGSLIVVPCKQDLLTQTPTESVVQMAIVNEFEQVFSSSFRFTCFSNQSLGRFITLSKSVAGGDSVHLVIRGVSTPLIGLGVDRFTGQGGTLHTTANEPFLEGARSSTVIFP